MSVSHEKIILIAPPRSLSTAFLRAMESHGGFSILNEPSLPVFNKKHYPHTAFMYEGTGLNSYAEVKAAYKNQNQPLFVKEMSYACAELFKEEPELVSDPACKFVFLLRDPHHALISYYRKLPLDFIGGILSDLELLTGYRSMWELLQLIEEKAVNQPHLIHAEELCQNPEKVLKDFFKLIKTPFNAACLSWKNHSDTFDGFKQWGDSKKQAFTLHWHGDAIQSTGFHQPSQYHTDKENHPVFDEIQQVQHRISCKKVYAANKHYYNLLNNAFKSSSASLSEV